MDRITAAVLRAALPVLGAACIGLAACGADQTRTDPGAAADDHPAPAVDGATETAGTAPAVLTCEMLPDGLLHVQPTRAALRGRYGEPERTAVNTEANRHVEGAIDSLFTLHYPGLEVAIRKPAGGDDMAETMDIRDNRYLRFADLGIGAPAAHVHDVLGRPWDTDGDRLVYNCGMGADQPTTFFVDDAHVTRILIEYYVD